MFLLGAAACTRVPYPVVTAAKPFSSVVLDANTGEPLARAEVCLLWKWGRWDPFGVLAGGDLYSYGFTASKAFTDRDGEFTVWGLIPHIWPFRWYEGIAAVDVARPGYEPVLIEDRIEPLPQELSALSPDAVKVNLAEVPRKEAYAAIKMHRSMDADSADTRAAGPKKDRYEHFVAPCRE